MTYDNYWTTPPDDDQSGDAARDEYERCPDCGVTGDEPCTKDCGCRWCLARDARLAAQRALKGDA